MNTAPDRPAPRTVAVLGAGVIGLSWTALFLAHGLRVRVHSRRADARATVTAALERMAPGLPGGGRDPHRLTRLLEIEPDLERAVRDADAVQENLPDDLELKRDLFRRVGAAAPPAALLLSSTSRLLPDAMGAAMADPGRVVVGHPLNPPHVVPLVEVLGGSRTDPATVEACAAFYRSVGRTPVVLRRPVPRFVANRIQAAVLRESVHLVEEGVVTMAELDTVVSRGLGVRWAAVGPFEAFHLGGGEGGLRRWLAAAGPGMDGAWRDLGRPRMTARTIEHLADAADQTYGKDGYAHRAAARDARQNAVLEALARAGAPGDGPDGTATGERPSMKHTETTETTETAETAEVAENGAAAEAGRDTVDFWFDPLCPWAWITSRWITEVAALRPLTVRWHEMSLALLNSGTEMSEQRRRMLDAYWGPIRVVAATRHAHGDEAVGRLYTALGGRLHAPDGIFAPVRDATADTWQQVMAESMAGVGAVVEAALRDAGLPAALAEEADSERWDDALRASHARVPSDGLRRELIGVPAVSVNGRAAHFGPVLSEIPTGERALRLWDALHTLATDPAFFELKRCSDRPEPRTVR
ncbi:mycothiol-dependent nitroreductase Rv2466c family protein [Streptomyces termitum]|uniref:mycothiol-dependent nitroreductase Rv2466c family protein n=1 Tax=Streptomyces termitum TaxID=67368 RepID=UPI0033B7402D